VLNANRELKKQTSPISSTLMTNRAITFLKNSVFLSTSNQKNDKSILAEMFYFWELVIMNFES